MNQSPIHMEKPLIKKCDCIQTTTDHMPRSYVPVRGQLFFQMLFLSEFSRFCPLYGIKILASSVHFAFTSEGTHLNKQEALGVMHEILAACNESLTINSVSLDSHATPNCMSFDGYKITMKCDLNDSARKCIQPILDKRNLIIEATEGNVLIY
jgi:hypothetical protein